MNIDNNLMNISKFALSNYVLNQCAPALVMRDRTSKSHSRTLYYGCAPNSLCVIRPHTQSHSSSRAVLAPPSLAILQLCTVTISDAWKSRLARTTRHHLVLPSALPKDIAFVSMTLGQPRHSQTKPRYKPCEQDVIYRMK